MPGYKRTRTRTRRPRRRLFKRRRFIRRKKHSKLSRISFRKNPYIIPDNTFVKLRYDMVISMTGTATTKNQYMRGNSCYDPDQTGLGGQPVGFDQWKALYDRYRVMGSSCSVKFINTGSNIIQMHLVPQMGTALISQAPQSVPYSKFKFCPPSTTSGVRMVKQYMSTRKIYGQSATDLDFVADVGANPTKQWYWMIYLQDVDLTANISGKLWITVFYYVKFQQRTQLNDA